MRKRNISYGLDQIMWTVIYIFPLLILLFGAVITPMGDLLEVVNTSDFVQDFASTGVYTALEDIFGVNGILPLFTGATGTAVLSYMTYFVNVLIIHLAVDFLVFIPRLAHKWMDKLFGGKNE